MTSLGDQMQQATAHFRGGSFQLAESCCRSVLEHSPNLFDARHLLALSLLQQGQSEAALEAMRRAEQLRPDDRQLRANLVLALIGTGRLEQACVVLKQLLVVDSKNTTLIFQLASLMIRLGRIEEAETMLLELLKLDSGHGPGNGALAQLLEQRQEDQRALEHAEVALRVQPDHFVAGLSRARVLVRQGREPEAQQEFLRLLESSDSRVNRSLILTALGKVEDRLGNYDRAYTHFEAANSELSLSAAARQVRDTSVYSSTALTELSDFFDGLRLARWSALAETMPEVIRSPIFLVGFPRSGTTLLDRMLDAHPDLAVVEEQPTLHAALTEFVQGADSLRKLESLDQQTGARLRDDYWNRIAACLPGNWNRDQEIIDKLPLNLVFVGLIYRIFPNARFIFAIRDPRDVCLSCFMQSFGLNDAMSHFLQLESTAHYYTNVMTLGLRQLDALPVAQHHCRYEDMIEDPAQQARAMLEFLQLPWDSSVLNYHQRVQGQRIDTPSYEQVAKPLYRSSLGRWKNYRAHLQPILAELQTFVDRFGYTDGS